MVSVWARKRGERDSPGWGMSSPVEWVELRRGPYEAKPAQGTNAPSSSLWVDRKTCPCPASAVRVNVLALRVQVKN